MNFSFQALVVFPVHDLKGSKVGYCVNMCCWRFVIWKKVWIGDCDWTVDRLCKTRKDEGGLVQPCFLFQHFLMLLLPAHFFPLIPSSKQRLTEAAIEHFTCLGAPFHRECVIINENLYSRRQYPKALFPPQWCPLTLMYNCSGPHWLVHRHLLLPLLALAFPSWCVREVMCQARLNPERNVWDATVDL